MAPETLTVTASIEHLDQAISFIEERADQFGLEPKKKFGLLIAVEEAFVNVCHYAYPASTGEVSLSCSSDSTDFVVELVDQGGHFDVLSLPVPDTSADIMDRQIGGLGVHFIRTLTDDVRYRREEGRNILRMSVNITRDPQHVS